VALRGSRVDDDALTTIDEGRAEQTAAVDGAARRVSSESGSVEDVDLARERGEIEDRRRVTLFATRS
jgi:hypothetical protein